MIFKRYLTIAVVLLALVASYFIFFYKGDKTTDYEIYYEKLMSQETYEENSELFDIKIEEMERENGNYDYIVTFENFTTKVENVKILIADKECKNEDKVYSFPSFGIISTKGFSFDKLENTDVENKIVAGTNLVIIDNKKISNILVYFAYLDIELFLSVPSA